MAGSTLVPNFPPQGRSRHRAGNANRASPATCGAGSTSSRTGNHRCSQPRITPEPHEDPAHRKTTPEPSETRILRAFHRPEDYRAPWGPLLRKTSCAVAYAHGEADYSGHYGISKLRDNCPPAQRAPRTADWSAPELEARERQACALGAVGQARITDRAILVKGLNGPPRCHLQHSHRYQVHDKDKPHTYRRHGRAEIGRPAA